MKNFSSIHSDLTEMTELKEGRSPDRPGGLETAAPWTNKPIPSGWILYDGQCRHCVAAAKQFERLFARRGFHFLPLQTPWIQEQLGLDPGAPLEEMRVLTEDGQDIGGADAVIFLAQQIWWSRPFWFLSKLPGVRSVVDRAYRWIAAHRGCTHIACNQPRSSVAGVVDPSKFAANHTPQPGSTTPATATRGIWPSWLGLFILPVLALLTRNRVAPWAFMWFMAGAIFLGCKWLTFWRARQHYSDLQLNRSPAYFFLWAGMDAAGFLGVRRSQQNISAHLRQIIFATLKIVLGTSLLFGVGRIAPNYLVAGWVGMIGMILILHFGLFDLAAIAWRIAGINAKPIMNAPFKSSSLSEFWGRRWNGAFNQLVLNIFFRQLSRSIGTIRATLTTFLLSGLLHEFVISLPAGAGYGLPTAYFLLQGWGEIAQRSDIGDRLGIRCGISGRVFTMFITAVPAFWLFHPPFVRTVILPFMRAIGAL